MEEKSVKNKFGSISKSSLLHVSLWHCGFISVSYLRGLLQKYFTNCVDSSEFI